ncbi:PssE/Cps14G family polysaccharide biosynthesis glycosyltransferase [Ectothiorhodospira variabilis]|uniref:PssE/Cps14G family polysaccharide biosynthesis glycosyltransferase n=1 Tax=Ectothiorhodospira variabilis TaxID=505694 RepID=UPI001EFC176D|nr:PssE/Cps14G family polysaccharide biosynthesis glycosyltransferase [Ectothiorhodospira variabilis]MCG5495339.1 hypothetical protein [Ectothiorhodospira variabilis]MCG5504937.1 hypothetical protein [Ectothiorhodospira variabilis]MCG5508094.1 hypothetical protein [Ectothiorhodospira variabilis]
MIFVTVGTTLPFDDLIRAMDDIVTSTKVKEKVICQIGSGEYLPQNCEYFRYTPKLDDFIDSASIVIGHGGTGTVLSLLSSGKPFVAVANPLGADDHQAQFLKRLEQAATILWTRDLSQLPQLILRARHHRLESRPGLRLADDLINFIDDL